MYNSVFLYIWIFFSPSSTCNFVHTRPSVSVMNGRSSQPPLCLHCEYQQAYGPSAETCPFPSFAGCYAGTAPVCFKTKLGNCIFLILFKMCMIMAQGKLGHGLKEKKRRFLCCFSLVLPLVLFSYL